MGDLRCCTPGRKVFSSSKAWAWAPSASNLLLKLMATECGSYCRGLCLTTWLDVRRNHASHGTPRLASF